MAATASPTAPAGLRREERRFTAGAVCLGVGFGGFVDGIVLHQVLQWHHLLTSTGEHPAGTVAGLEANTLADGLFHAATWIAAFAGVLLVTAAMRAGYRGATPHQLGLVVAGWGAFNLVEGTIDHQILGIHHVRTGDAQAAYDLGFLAFGAVLLLSGLALARRGQDESRRRSGFPPP